MSEDGGANEARLHKAVRPARYYAIAGGLTALGVAIILWRALCPASVQVHVWARDEAAWVSSADYTVQNGPEPAVGLYWYASFDPTTGAGMAAPLNQLLVRTDTPSIYYKSGVANTAWTLIGTSGGGGGVTGTGTPNTIPKWATTTSIENSSAIDNSTDYTIGTGGFEVVEATGETMLPEIDLTGHVTAPVLSGTTNNWNPTGTGNLNGIARIDEAPSANVTITGLNVGNAAQVVSIHNTATAFTLTLANANAGSLAVNQFTNPNAGDITIPPGGAATLRTSASASGWRVWNSGTANAALTANDLAIATDTNTIGNYGGSTAAACPAGEADTQPALSAAGVISAATCVAFAPAGNISGTTNTIAKFSSSSAVGNSGATDNGTTYAIGTGGMSVLEATGETLLPEIDLTGHATAPVLSGTTNNWNPTGTGSLSGIARIDEAPSANVIVTGLNVGNASQVVSIHNTATAFTLTLANANAGSLAANQFTNPNAGDITIPPGGAVTLRTNATATGWRPFDSGVMNSALTANDLAIATDTNTIGNYGGSTAAACPAGEADTQPALSAAGVISAATCVAFAPAGNISGTTNTIAKFSSSSAVGNSNETDDGTNFKVGASGRAVNIANGYDTYPDTSLPSAPSASVNVLASLWGRPQATFEGPDGLPVYAQRAFGNTNIHCIATNPGSTVYSGFGIANANVNVAGTATARTPATTNIVTAASRVGYVSASTAASVAGASFRQQYLWLGNGTNLGGFTFWARYAITDASLVSTGRAFVGVQNSVAAPTDVDPNTITNIIGICQDDGDTNWFICANGASASSARTNLTSTFPINTTDIVEIVLFSAPDSGTVSYAVKQIGAGAGASGVIATGTISSNLPSATTLLSMAAWRSNGGTASAVAIDTMNICSEAPF